LKDEEILRLLDAAAEPDPARILDALMQLTKAERGFIVLRDAIPLARHMDGDEVRRALEKVSRTLLERALADGRTIVATDAEMSGIGSLQEQKVRSVAVVPLRVSGAAVYLDHRYEKGLFADRALLDRAAAALDRALARRGDGHGGLIGASKPMKELYKALDRVAEAPYPVLIVGESGTGKELVARLLHRDGPFVVANCATLPEQLVDSELFGHAKGAFTGAERDRVGLFEQADGGLLFLDEVACLSSAAQESLLRILESGELRRIGDSDTKQIKVRVVAATNEDLEYNEGFRRDLYFRLNVLRLELPSLRDRKEDLPLIAEHWLDRIAAETKRSRKQLSTGAMAALLEHRWPGNVRELVNAPRRLARGGRYPGSGGLRVPGLQGGAEDGRSAVDRRPYPRDAGEVGRQARDPGDRRPPGHFEEDAVGEKEEVGAVRC
jgi:transcriptional regulator with PAS, ATPase and Fis domain